jgi:hypothetical protein
MIYYIAYLIGFVLTIFGACCLVIRAKDKLVVPFSGWNTNYKYIGKTK